MSCGAIFGFGLVSSDRYEVVRCLLGLALIGMRCWVWVCEEGFDRNGLYLGFCWFCSDWIGTVRKVLLELIGSD